MYLVCPKKGFPRKKCNGCNRFGIQHYPIPFSNIKINSDNHLGRYVYKCMTIIKKTS